MRNLETDSKKQEEKELQEELSKSEIGTLSTCEKAVLITAIGIILFIFANIFANRARGYESIGGEMMFIFLYPLGKGVERAKNDYKDMFL